MNDTYDVVNALRQHIATPSDLLGLAADCGRWDVHAKYEELRRELNGTLCGAVDAGLDDLTLTGEEADRALSPIASLEMARVF